MAEFITYLPHLMIAFTTYILATASPGPATLAIMGTSMRAGRSAGLSLAAGVICGSVTWGFLAAFGLSAVMARFGFALEFLRIAGGLYLLWLAWKSFKSAWKPGTPINLADKAAPNPLKRYYLKGLAIHLINPKAVFSWLAIMTLGLRPGAPEMAVAWILCGCFALGLTIFGGYALLFSTPVMVRFYARTRRALETVLGLVFGAAGIRLLSAQV